MKSQIHENQKNKLASLSKNLILAIGLFTTLLTSTISFSQTNRKPASLGRAEYIEVEKGVKLHVTDLGEGQPIPRSRANHFAWFYNLKY